MLCQGAPNGLFEHRGIQASSPRKSLIRDVHRMLRQALKCFELWDAALFGF